MEPLVLRRAEQVLAMRLIADHGGGNTDPLDETTMNTPPDLLLGLA